VGLWCVVNLTGLWSCLPSTTLNCADNLVVGWGVQDNYEIVRKVGRGKYSEVRLQLFRARAPLMRYPGLRVDTYPDQSEVHRKGFEAGQEKEDQERDQDSAKSGGWPECDWVA
jgi:hypothetical protein